MIFGDRFFNFKIYPQKCEIKKIRGNYCIWSLNDDHSDFIDKNNWSRKNFVKQPCFLEAAAKKVQSRAQVNINSASWINSGSFDKR